MVAISIVEWLCIIQLSRVIWVIHVISKNTSYFVISVKVMI